MMQDWADFLEETLRSGEYKLIPPSYKIEHEQKPEDDLTIKKREKANPEYQRRQSPTRKAADSPR